MGVDLTTVTKLMLPWMWRDGEWRRESTDGQTLAVFDHRYEANYEGFKQFADEKLKAQGWTEEEDGDGR